MFLHVSHNQNGHIVAYVPKQPPKRAQLANVSRFNKQGALHYHSTNLIVDLANLQQLVDHPNLHQVVYLWETFRKTATRLKWMQRPLA